MELTT